MRRMLTIVVCGAALAACSATTTTATAPSTTTPSTKVGTSSTAPGTTEPTDDSVPGGDGEYCATAKAINEKTSRSGGGGNDGGKAPSAEIAEVFSSIRAARDLGPEALAESWNVVLDAVTALADIDADDVAGAMEIVLDPAFAEAAAKISDYTEEECGFGLEGLSPGDSNEAPSGTTVGGSDDLPTACRTLTGLSEDDKTDPLSLYAVRTAVCRAHPDASWLTWIVTRSAWSSQNEVEWAVTVPDDQDTSPTVSADDALEACVAIDEYLKSVGTMATITIGTGPMEDLPKAKTVLVTKATPDGSCAKA